MPPASDRAAIVRANTSRNVARARALRRELAKAGPAHLVTWAGVWWVFPITGVLDLLRFVFVFLVFTAPVILGGGAAALATLSSWTSWIPPSVVAAVAGGAAGALELLQPEIAAAVEAFGAIMAMIIGLFGFILIAFILATLRVKLSGPNAMRLFLAFVGGVMPFADAAPSLTTMSYHILHHQIKEDRKAVAAHKAEQARLQAQLRQLELADRAEQLQLRAAMQAQEAANDNEAVRQEEEAEEQEAGGDATNRDVARQEKSRAFEQSMNMTARMNAGNPSTANMYRAAGAMERRRREQNPLLDTPSLIPEKEREAA